MSDHPAITAAMSEHLVIAALAAAARVREAMGAAHEHVWFECFRQADPPVRVLDCRCGARRKVYPGSGSGQPEIENVTPHPGGSIHNCLINVTGNSHSISGLGDPQGDRMRMLIAQQEQGASHG